MFAMVFPPEGGALAGACFDALTGKLNFHFPGIVDDGRPKSFFDFPQCSHGPLIEQEFCRQQIGLREVQLNVL